MTAVNSQINNSMASLYVGDLHPDVTETMIYEKFSICGPVLSIRVCRDMITRKSLGYAYVNFQNSPDAERAMDRMNFDTMKGKSIRIMWSQRDPSLRKSGVGNIFIKNLDKSITHKELHDTFLAFGNILSCKISSDERGKSKGYGFVHFETEIAATNAIEAINGMLIKNKKVFVGKFIPRSNRSDSDSDVKFTNCYVKNFADDLDNDKIKELFQDFGEISSAKVMIDENGKSKGFGFVCFNDSEAAESAVKSLNGKMYKDRQLYVGRAQKKNERLDELRSHFDKQRAERSLRYAQGVNLYVKNLDDFIDDFRLKQEFIVFGNITSAKVMTDSNNRSKGFGFVCFSNSEEATKAVTEMNGKICGSKPLYVALAQRKDDRKAHLASQYMQRVNPHRNSYANDVSVNTLISGGPPGGPSILPYAFAQNQSTSRVYSQNTSFTPPQNRWSNRMHPGQLQFNGGNMRQMTNPHFGSLEGLNIPMQNNTMAMQSAQMRHVPMLPNQRPMLSNNANASSPGMMMNGGNNNMKVVPQNSRPITGSQMTMSSQNTNVNLQRQQNPITRQSGVTPNTAQTRHTGSINHFGSCNIEPLTISVLASVPIAEQKQMLGERLYPLVHIMHPDLAGKITGMLLEIDNTELLHMLESNESLTTKIDEAMNVLQCHKYHNLTSSEMGHVLSKQSTANNTVAAI